MEKMTMKDKYTAIIEVLTTANADPALIEFCEERIEKLDAKKAATSARKTVEKDDAFDLIVDVMSENPEGMTATQILTRVKAIATPEQIEIIGNEEGVVTVQKITALLKAMGALDRVTKDKTAKGTIFKLL